MALLRFRLVETAHKPRVPFIYAKTIGKQMRFLLLFLLILSAGMTRRAIAVPTEGLGMSQGMADEWASLVLKGVETEFPNKLSLVYSSGDQIKAPRQHFPAFFGCFDWHSSVHGHWVLVRLLKRFPDMNAAETIRATMRAHLSRENLVKEASFFAKDEQRAFERMYGWAWLLRLVVELEQWDDPEARSWRENLRPLESILVGRILEYLPKLTYPIRIGQHTDTGFALGQIFDYATQVDNGALKVLVNQRALSYYAEDRGYPVHYEPSGHDFFSSCWNEADLMRRVLPQSEFVVWLDRFLPNLKTQLIDGTITPVVVSDASDPKIVHLAGLNLNRAWCLDAVANALPKSHPVRQKLESSAKSHLESGLRYINSGHYEGDHWLATFGLYAIDQSERVHGGE